MTPYVELQILIIKWLECLKEKRLNDLEKLLKICKAGCLIDWYEAFERYGLTVKKEDWHNQFRFSDLILEQIDDSGEEIKILNLLGTSLQRYHRPYNLNAWVNKRGSGNNMLRTEKYSQPRALKDGDVLITGETVLGEPREGGNGSVLVKLSNGVGRNIWLSFPSRMALALIGSHDGELPEGLIEK